MARSALDRFSFGGRISGAIGLLLVLTISVSLAVAFGERHAGALFAAMPLVPELVFRGQIWRVVTWLFVEPDLFPLVFRCLFLYWLGSDLVAAWGTRRFLSVYFGTSLVAAVGTCLVALLDAGVRSHVYLASWALDSALTVAWGLLFPDRVIRIYFIIPIRGTVLAWGTVALTIGYAVFYGWDRVLPVMIAEATMLAYLYRGMLKRRFVEHRVEKRQAAREVGRRRSASHLRVIEGGDKLGKLAPEDEAQLDRLFGEKRERPRSPDDLN